MYICFHVSLVGSRSILTHAYIHATLDKTANRDISAALRKRREAGAGGVVETAEEQEARKREQKRQVRLC